MTLDSLSKSLIETYQKGFPLSERPYADIAEQMGVSEQEVIDTLIRLKDEGAISRVGPVFAHHKAGASTLAALSVPDDKLDEVAKLVSDFHSVNHNYRREHKYNLWFVVTAENQYKLDRSLIEIERLTGYTVLNLPMEKSYHIDLSFKPHWG